MSPKILLPAAVLAGVACFFVGWKVGRLQMERRLQRPKREWTAVFGDSMGYYRLGGVDAEYLPWTDPVTEDQARRIREAWERINARLG